MASTIRIKKRASSGSAGAPSSLASSELAFNENASDKKLYYGYGDNGSGVATSIIAIGGPGAFCDLTTTQTIGGDKTFSDDVVVTGDLTVNGTTSTLATTNSVVKDTLIELGNGASGTPSNDSGIVIERGSADNAFIGYDESADKFTVGTGSFTGASTGDLSITTGTIVANIEGNVTGNVTGNSSGSSGSCTGNAATATALANARTIGGTSFDGTANIAVNLAATATALATARTIGGTSFDGTANIAVALSTEATNVTASANNSADETVYPTFVDGATGTQGIETDTGLTYNPSSGLLTSTLFAGALTGNVTGNASGSSGSCTGNAATATTAAALTTGRTIAGVSFDGSANISLNNNAITNGAGYITSSGNAATATSATNATHVVLTDNESTNENNAIPFGEGATYTGNVGLESDGDFHYNPSTGTVTATAFAGTLDGGTF